MASLARWKASLVSCKYCGRLKTVIRGWLGIDQIITKQGLMFSNLIESQVTEKLREMMRAGKSLEDAVAALDSANTELHLEHKETFERIRLDLITIDRNSNRHC